MISNRDELQRGRVRGRKRGRGNNSGSGRLTVVLVIALLITVVLCIGFFMLKNKKLNENVESEVEEFNNETLTSTEDNSDEEYTYDELISEEVSETEALESQVSEPAELLFGGDVYLSDFVIDAYNKAGGIHGVLSEDYLREIDNSDLFIANEEFPFSDRGEKAPDKQFTFRLPTENVNILKEMGLDIVSLANNHSLDYGETALIDTVDTLDKANILHIGAGKNKASAREPIIMDIKGKKFGFIAATRVIPVSSWAAGKDKPGLFICYDPSELISDVAKLEEICDYTIVFLHWGTEKKETPDSYMESMAKELVKNGADAVIGSHPHVLQPIEIIDGKPVIYSLGNFVFGSRINRTMLVKLIFDDEDIRLELLPGKGAMGFTEMLNDEEKDEFIQNFPISESSIS